VSQRISPIQRFLALGEREPDPFTLLGLDPEACDEQAVHAALHRRLERIARHPEALSHEADEVRLALHAAAAQLLDPDVRAQLGALRQQSGRPSVARPSGDAAAAPPSPFEDMALRVLARCGGWNRDARLWLAGLSHAFGVPEDRLPDILQRIAAEGPGRRHQDASRLISGPPVRSNGEATPPGAKATAAPVRARPEQEDEEPVPPLWLRLIVPGTLVAAAVTIALIVIAVSDGDAPSRNADSPQRSGEPAAVPAPVTGGAPGELRAERSADPALPPPRPPAEILDWLRESVEVFPETPGDAAWRFDRAVTDLARTWIDFEPPALGQAHELVLEFAHLATPQAESARRAIDALAAPLEVLVGDRPVIEPDDVAPAIWSAGMLSRLTGERELPGRTLQDAAARSTQALGQPAGAEASTFIAGAEAALESVASRLARSADVAPDGAPERTVETWRRWRRAAHAAAAFGRWRGAWSGPSARPDLDWLDRVTLAGAERIMRSDDPSMRAEARDALVDLLESVRWTSVDEAGVPPAWRAVLTWFDEESLPTADLAVATEWLVAESEAPGLDLRMTLSRAAGPAARSVLRDRYAGGWGLESQAASGVSSMWRRAVARAMEAAVRPGSGSIIERLSLAARYARLNEASARRWRGQTQMARDVLLNVMRPIDQARAQSTRSTASVRDDAPSNDGAWTVRFMEAGNDQEARARLLVQLDRRGGRLGPIDAETLAETALWGVPTSVRDRAQRVVRRRKDEVPIQYAILESLPRAPRTTTVSALVEDVADQRLPPVSAQDWPLTARRALVERLLPALTGVDAVVAVDALSRVISRAYRARVAEVDQGATTASADASAAGEEGDAGDPSGPAAVASRVWSAHRRAALRFLPNTRAPHSLLALERRRTARLRLARGALSRFAAEQVSVAEMLGHIVIAERPSRADVAMSILERMRESRERSVDLVDQILATERAILALWTLRLGEDDLLAEPPDAKTEDPA